MFKIPSIKILSDQFLATISRFKWVTLVAVVKTIFFICLTETKYEQVDLRDSLTRILFVLHLALPLSLAISLVVQRRRWKFNTELILVAGLIALLAVYYFFINPNPNLSDTWHWYL